MWTTRVEISLRNVKLMEKWKLGNLTQDTAQSYRYVAVRASFFCFVCIVFVFNNLALVTFFSTENSKSLRHVSYWWLGLETFIQKTLRDTLPHAEKAQDSKREAFLFYYHTHISSLCEFIIPLMTTCLTLEINIYFTFLSLTLKIHCNE